MTGRMSLRRSTMVEIDRRVPLRPPPDVVHNLKNTQENVVSFAAADAMRPIKSDRQSPQNFQEDAKRRKSRVRRQTLMPIRRGHHEDSLPVTPEPDDILDDEVLFSRLQKMFDAAAEEGEPGLPIDKFKEAVRRTIGRHNTTAEIELLFMKVDANCDGLVDWEEYVTYNLLEYKEKTQMMEMLRVKPFPNEIREIDSRHREIIVKIIFYPTLRKSCPKRSNICQKSGKYMTLSKDGVLGIWTLAMRNLVYYNANQFQNRNTPPWFTDMVPLYNVNMIAVTSTDRDILIFDLTGKKFTMRYFLTGFENCITAMDYWVDLNDLNNSVLLFGDTSGSVCSIKFESALRGGLFGVAGEKKNACKKVSFQEVVRGYILGVKGHKIPNVHEDWVNKVMYLPDIECFLSSCQNAQTALFFGDFRGKKNHVYFKVIRGVLSFDYSQSLNIIVTGGMDYMLHVWNPYVNNKAIVLLKGHTKPVNHVIINETKHQVISIDKGRSLRVFDLRDQTCLQHISGRMIRLDPFPISAVVYNPAMRTTLLGANRIIMMEKREEEEGYSEAISHNKPLVSALYSKVFDSVVSACQESVVSVWDINTGVKTMQFVNAHFTVERGIEVPVEITALCFDYNGRRLVTGARNGTVHVWNFNNGSLMQNFALPDSSAVAGLACTKHHFYVCGWGKMIHIYADGRGEEDRKNWKINHTDDILSIAYFPPNIIATGSYDGDVIIWSHETGQMYCRLNAFEQTKPINRNGAAQNMDVGYQRRQSGDENPDIPSWQRKTMKMKSTLGFVAFSKQQPEENRLNSEDVEASEIRCEHPLLQALDPETFNAECDQKFRRDKYDNVCKNYESSVEKIIFLECREPLQKDTAIIVTSGAEGWIRFWSMHHEGGLLGQFNASHRLGESVLTITCDSNNTLLLTGDTAGYVKIWDIGEYCTKKRMTFSERRQHINDLRKKFTFFRVEYHKEETVQGGRYTVPSYLKNVFAHRPPPLASDPESTLRYPVLVNSFRAHVRCIHSVDYVTDRELIITGAADCSVRLWTLNGQFIGIFGGDRWAPLPKIVTNDYFLAQIPNDIRRAGSARTLRVLHGGKTPKWDTAIDIVKQRGIERLKKQFDHLQEVVEETLDKEHKSRSTSNILGKSYKKTMHHRMLPVLPKFIETRGSVAVYHTLPFVELTPVEPFNDMMKEIQARRAGNLAFMKLKGLKQKKPDQPAMVNVFNKLVNKQGSPLPKPKPANRIRKLAERYQNSLQLSRPPDARGKEGRIVSKSVGGEVLEETEDSVEMAETPIGRRTSSTLSTHSRADFKLPSIVE